MLTGIFDLILNFISMFTGSWNLKWFINLLKSWEDSVLVGVPVLTVSSTEEWSEFRS